MPAHSTGEHYTVHASLDFFGRIRFLSSKNNAKKCKTPGVGDRIADNTFLVSDISLPAQKVSTKCNGAAWRLGHEPHLRGLPVFSRPTSPSCTKYNIYTSLPTLFVIVWPPNQNTATVCVGLIILSPTTVGRPD